MNLITGKKLDDFMVSRLQDVIFERWHGGVLTGKEVEQMFIEICEILKYADEYGWDETDEEANEKFDKRLWDGVSPTLDEYIEMIERAMKCK